MKFIIKRTLPVFLSLFAVIFLFSGCGDKSENEVLKGKWVPVSAVISVVLMKKLYQKQINNKTEA